MEMYDEGDLPREAGVEGLDRGACAACSSALGGKLRRAPARSRLRRTAWVGLGSGGQG